MSRMYFQSVLLLFIVAFLAVGLTYDVTVPIFEKPDESFHFFFAVRLARGQGLPDQRTVTEADLWQQEGSQPPLYHLLAGALISPLSLDGAESHARRNPHNALGMPKVPGNTNIFVHAPDAGLFETPTHTAVHLARWLSLLMGAITVAGTWLLTRELLPARPWIAWATAAFVAFTPQFLFISTAVSNDATVAAVVTVALWLLVRAVRRGITPVETAMLAVAVGAAALTKLNGLIFLTVAVGMLVLVAWRGYDEDAREGRVPPLYVAGTLVIAVGLIAGWWYWRNWQLYGDPTGLSAMLDVIGRRDDPLTWSYLKWELSGLGISYWALFGWFNLLVDDWFYSLMGVVVGVALLGLVWRAVSLRRWRDDSPLPRRWLPVLAWPLLVFAGLVRWTMMTPGLQGRLLFPAIAPIAILIVLGWTTLVPKRWQRAFLLVAGTVWLAWALVVPWRTIAPAYRPPPHGPDIALPAGAIRVGYQYNETVELIGYTLEPARVGRSEPFHLTLYWRTGEQLDRNYSVGVKVFGYDGQLIAREDTYPGLGTYPTEFWQTNEIIVDRYKIWISGQADLPVLGDIWIDLYTREDIQAVPVTTAEGEPLSVPRIGRLKVAPPPAPAAAPPAIRFADGIGLADVRVEPAQVRPGEMLTATLTWQPYATPSTDYTVFLHLVPAETITAPLAQTDGLPRNGAYPTSVWEAGERITDTHSLPAPTRLTPGEYDLLAGLYRPDTLARLSIESGQEFVRLARLSFDGERWVLQSRHLRPLVQREAS